MRQSRLRRFGAMIVGATLALTLAAEARSMPMFARQTSLKCGMCHSPPPELTPFGRRFMLNGFTLSSVKPKLPPVSAYFLTSYALMDKQPDPKPAGSLSEGSVELQQATLATGGRITRSVGAYVGLDYDGIQQEIKLGTLDVRRIGNTTAWGKDLLYGVALNNDPGIQDPWNSSPRRNWPYGGSALEPQASNRVALDGVLSRRVLGASAYGFLEDSLYVEAAAYTPQSEDFQDGIGVYDRNNRELDDTGLYLRLAKEHRLQSGSFTYGTMYFDADIADPFGGPTSSVRDFAVDAQFQRARGMHDFTIGVNYLQEFIDTSEHRSAGLASGSSNELKRFRMSVSDLYNKTWGFGAGYAETSGSTDPLYFGTASGDPDTASIRLEVFCNPISLHPPAWYPWLSTRIGLQYIHYTRFNGSSNDYDGRGRDAGDNDSVVAYWVLAF